MKFEKLNYGKEKNKRMFLYGFIVCAIFLVLLNIIISKALYRKTESVQLATGTVNYSVADVNIIAAYIKNKEDEDYKKVNDIPQENRYALNSIKSTCTNGAIPKWEKSELRLANLTKTGTKCTLYFDEFSLIATEVIAMSKGKIETFTGTTCDENTNYVTHTLNNCTDSNSGIFEAEDDYGTSYYFRGTVDNNWVKIGTEYWRIIRINGNGTIRLIYSGTQLPTDSEGNGKWVKPGTTAKINSFVTKSPYNLYYSDNKYVGFMYGVTKSGTKEKETSPGITTSYEQAHQNNFKSDIMEAIETWYNESDLKNYAKYLDGATGFCNDRQINEVDDQTWWERDSKLSERGYANNYTAYAAYHKIRTVTSSYRDIQTPTLKCGNKTRDLFTTNEEQGYGNGALTYPIGLITGDEVIYAGGFGGKGNYGFWLNIGQHYWTMTPHSTNVVLVVEDNGQLDGNFNVTGSQCVRPVINLKTNSPIITKSEDIKKGTINNPYILEAT